MKRRQVIVVGGGVGGSSASFHMAKAGIDVLMLEKDQFPRDKPCGDGVVSALNPILRSMGVYDEVVKNAYPSEFIRMYAPDDSYCRFQNKTSYHAEPAPLLCIPRYIFDDLINKAAIRAGADCIENFEATEVIMEHGKAKGVRGIHDGKIVEIESDLVVLASGSHSMLARQMGFYDEDPDYVYYGLRGYFEDIRGMDDVEFFYPDHFLPAGYIWFFPKSKTCANVGVFITETALKKTGKTMEQLLWDWRDNTRLGQERLGKARLLGQLKGWRLPSGKRRPIYAGGVLAVGDSGNMVEQHGGAGIPQAIFSGQIAAQVAKEALDANDFSKSFFKRYSDYVDKLLGPTFEAMDVLRNEGFSTPEQLKKFIKFMNDNQDAELTDFIVQECGYVPSSPETAVISH